MSGYIRMRVGSPVIWEVKLPREKPDYLTLILDGVTGIEQN